MSSLLRVEPVSVLRLVGSVNPEAVELAGTQTRNVAVPHLVSELRKREPCGFATPIGVIEANLHARGIGGEHRKVDAVRIRGRAQSGRAGHVRC